MKTTLKAVLAAALLTGAGTQAMAQGHDHGDHGDRGGSGRAEGPHAQGPRAAPGGQPQQPRSGGAQPGGMTRRVAPANPGFRGERGPGQTFQRHGAPGGEAVGHEAGGHEAGGREAGGQRFQGQPPRNDEGADRRFDHGAAPGRGEGRQGDHQRGPQVVIPPGVADRGPNGRHDGRAGGSGFDRRGEGRGNDGHDGRRGGPDRWRPGHSPSVYWSQHRYRLGHYRQPYGYYARAWAFGDFLPRGWFGQDYWLGDFDDYGLPYPPPGFEWVRVGDDAIMVDQYTGRIVQVVRGIFW